MNKFGGNISKTADFVGMERSALHRKMKQLGIQTVSKQNSNDSDESSDAVDYRESA
jgi:two-component system nitrogen regulation response regulator NtrX